MTEPTERTYLDLAGLARRGRQGRVLLDPVAVYLALGGTVPGDRGELERLISMLRAAPPRPLADPQAPRQAGVYVLYLPGRRKPVYVGHANGRLGLQGRLREHARTLRLHQGVEVDSVRCRFVAYTRRAPLARLEAALIRRLQPEWNALVGFGSGRAGKGLPPLGGGTTRRKNSSDHTRSINSRGIRAKKLSGPTWVRCASSASRLRPA
jgi:hypothetical protein